MMRPLLLFLAGPALLAGCSSRPRDFNPQLAIAPAEQARFDAAYAECRQLHVDGKLDGDGRLASAGTAAAAGGATMAAGAAAATSAGIVGGAAIASATVILIPVAVIGGAIGMAEAKRNRKEAEVQRVMNGCLRERGFMVSSWERAPRK